MKDIYLEVTYRDGSPWVAYLYLPRKEGDKSDRCIEVEPDMVLDINAEGKLIGIELVTPELVTLEGVNGVLDSYAFPPVDAPTTGLSNGCGYWSYELRGGGRPSRRRAASW